MSNQFIREDRYIVFKVSDLGNSFKGDEIRQLAREYAEHRRLNGKPPLDCIVVESDWPEYEPTWRAIEARVTGAQPAPKVVAYLDLGAGGYTDIGTDLNDEQLTSLSKGRHMLGIVGTYGVDGYVSAQPAPSEGSITAGILSGMFLSLDGRDKAQPGYEWRKGWNDAIRQAMDYAQPVPSGPEGWRLVPTAESRHPGIYKMLGALHTVDNTPGASEWESYAAFLAAAPESKP